MRDCPNEPGAPPRSLWRTRGPVNLGGGSALYWRILKPARGMPVRTVGRREEGPKPASGLKTTRSHGDPFVKHLVRRERAGAEAGFGGRADVVCSQQVLRLVTLKRHRFRATFAGSILMRCELKSGNVLEVSDPSWGDR